MIGIFDYSTTPEGRLAVAYNGLTFNVTTTAESTSTNMSGYWMDAAASKSAFDYIMEVEQQRDGLEVYNIHKAARIISMRGRVSGTDYYDMYDKQKALGSAFDPSMIKFQNTDPFIALTFSTPTNDTTNFPTHLAASKYMALPIRMPEPVDTFGPFGFTFSVDMLLRDPRRFLQAQSSRSGTGSTTSIGDFVSWPTTTIAMSGAGNAAFTVVCSGGTYQGTKTLVLDLSGRSNGQTVTVDHERSRILVGTTETPGIFVSGTFFQIEPGAQTITFSNTTNTSSRVLTYYPAYSL